MHILFFKNEEPHIASFALGKASNVKKLKKDPDMSKYITLREYLSKINKKYRKMKNLQENLECDIIYVLKGDNEEKIFEDLWWLDVFSMCKKCTYSCKQSHLISGLSCREYKEMKIAE
jgi:hypothetical protein